MSHSFVHYFSCWYQACNGEHILGTTSVKSSDNSKSVNTSEESQPEAIVNMIQVFNTRKLCIQIPKRIKKVLHRIFLSIIQCRLVLQDMYSVSGIKTTLVCRASLTNTQRTTNKTLWMRIIFNLKVCHKTRLHCSF